MYPTRTSNNPDPGTPSRDNAFRPNSRGRPATGHTATAASQSPQASSRSVGAGVNTRQATPSPIAQALYHHTPRAASQSPLNAISAVAAPSRRSISAGANASPTRSASVESGIGARSRSAIAGPVVQAATKRSYQQRAGSSPSPSTGRGRKLLRPDCEASHVEGKGKGKLTSGTATAAPPPGSWKSNYSGRQTSRSPSSHGSASAIEASPAPPTRAELARTAADAMVFPGKCKQINPNTGLPCSQGKRPATFRDAKSYERHYYGVHVVARVRHTHKCRFCTARPTTKQYLRKHLSGKHSTAFESSNLEAVLATCEIGRPPSPDGTTPRGLPADVVSPSPARPAGPGGPSSHTYSANSVPEGLQSGRKSPQRSRSGSPREITANVDAQSAGDATAQREQPQFIIRKEGRTDYFVCQGSIGSDGCKNKYKSPSKKLFVDHWGKRHSSVPRKSQRRTYLCGDCNIKEGGYTRETLRVHYDKIHDTKPTKEHLDACDTAGPGYARRPLRAWL